MKRLLFFVLLMAIPATGFATTVVALPEAELIRLADTIVLASVIQSTSSVGPNGQVRTQSLLQVQRGLRGAEEGDVITVEVPGGRLPNGLIAAVHGAPQWRMGQMIFGFFETRGAVKVPLGLAYGVYDVQIDRHRQFIVERHLDGLNLLALQGKQASPERYTLNREPLDNLMNRVRSRLQNLAGGSR